MSDDNRSNTGGGFGVFLILTFIIGWLWFNFAGGIYCVAINCAISFMGFLCCLIPIYGIYWFWVYCPDFVEIMCTQLLGVDSFGWLTFIYIIVGICVTVGNIVFPIGVVALISRRW